MELIDLRKQPPRSPRDTFAGVVMAPRTTDKARAHLAGTLGAYIFNCGMDKKLFSLLGTNAEEFADAVRRAQHDADVEAFVHEMVGGKSPAEIDAWNRQFLSYEPDLSRPAYKDAVEALRRRAPGRTDVTLWADLMDVEEGRPVPSEEEVRAHQETLAVMG